MLYLLQHLLKCGECGHNFHARCTRSTTNVRNGKKYRYDLPTPNRYYMCNGMQSMRLRCRERPYIRAERLEEPIWSEVKRVIQNPDLIVAGIDTLDSPEGGGLEEEIAQAERDLRSIQMEEDRAIRLFVSGKITEAQLDHQRKFITERLESARAKLDDCRVQEASGAEKRRLMKYVLAWAKKVGKGVDKLTDEERKGILQTIVEEVVIDRNDYVKITLAIPVDYNSPEPGSPEPESVAFASKVPCPQCSSIPARRRGQGDGRRVPAGLGAGEGGRQEQAGIGHQAMVVKEDADTVGIVLWRHLLGAPCFRAGFCSKTIIPDSEERTLASSRAVPKAVLRWIRAKARAPVRRHTEAPASDWRRQRRGATIHLSMLHGYASRQPTAQSSRRQGKSLTDY